MHHVERRLRHIEAIETPPPRPIARFANSPAEVAEIRRQHAEQWGCSRPLMIVHWNSEAWRT